MSSIKYFKSYSGMIYQGPYFCVPTTDLRCSDGCPKGTLGQYGRLTHMQTSEEGWRKSSHVVYFWRHGSVPFSPSGVCS